MNVKIDFPSLRALPAIVVSVRRVFDLDADAALIDPHLAQDPWLTTLIARLPGLRVPGAWDGFELAVRAVLGQQVSLQAGRTLTSKLVQLCGSACAASPDLTRVFPTAVEVANADLSALSMPNARRAALFALARAVVADPEIFAVRETVEKTVARLREIRGVGEWTAHYIAMRAAGEPDAFPASDVALLRSVAALGYLPAGQRDDQVGLMR